MKPQQLLEHIGLNHHESGIYLYVLETGEQSASMVARATKTPRTTARATLDKLCERGLMTKLYKRNTQYYSCKDPTHLTKYIAKTIEEAHEHIDLITHMLPMLSALHKKNSVVPTVKFFEGKAGVIEAFNHSLHAEEAQEILFITSYKFLQDPVIKKNDDNYYIPLRVKKGIRLRAIVAQTEENDAFVKFDASALRERRFISDVFTFPGNFHVYNNFVAYFSAGDKEYMAVLIESAPMATTMRSIFEFMWQACGTEGNKKANN